MLNFDRSYAEDVLISLDNSERLFPHFKFSKLNNELKLLGTGGFSMVYEMYNIERPDNLYAVKVTGFNTHTLDRDQFENTVNIQWIIAQESKYVMRVLEAKEIDIEGDEGDSLNLQFVLMEKLTDILEKDRFGKANLLIDELHNENEVIKLAVEIGQALLLAHSYKFLHRDIKLENIFWDEKENVYKLGDFGVSKWAEDGNADTIIYTDGYGAPEIERKLSDNYNLTADIYSFGITLYLLLNNLKFPGSDEYRPNIEIQYNPEFVFPAPENASASMARVIRKMCSYRSADRYQSMNEVLIALSEVIDIEESEDKDIVTELLEVVTETYKEETTDDNSEKNDELQENDTRINRLKRRKFFDQLYRKENAKYFFWITILFVLLFKGIEPDTSKLSENFFWIIPVLTLSEAVFQKIKDFKFVFGSLVLICLAWSAYSTGLTMPHIILTLCVLSGLPLLTIAGSLASYLWLMLEISDKLKFLDYLYKWDIGWIILIVVLLVVYYYFNMRTLLGIASFKETEIFMEIYDKSFLIISLFGAILFALEKCNVITVPVLLERIHLVRTGIISFIILCIIVRNAGTSDEQYLD